MKLEAKKALAHAGDRRRRRLGLVLIVGVLGVLAASQPAFAAPGVTFSAATDPAAAGTAARPAPLDVSTDVKIKTDATGTPAVAVSWLVEALPAEFVDELARFGTCGRQVVIDKGSDACPRNSILGKGQIKVSVPQILLNATTDRMEMVNLGGGKIIMWFKVNQPSYSGTIDGALSQEGAPFGPVVTWDFTPASSGSGTGGLETRLVELQSTFLRSAAVAGSSQPGRAQKPRHQASCTAKAKRIKGRTKRKRALRRCARLKKKRHRKHPRLGPTSPGSQAVSQMAPFAATGCANANWPFQARVTFKDGSRQQADASVGCSGGSTGGGAPAPPPSLLCPPLCMPMARRSEP